MTTDRDDMLVGLYINQNKKDELIEFLINLTYKKISNLKMSLDSYVSLYDKEKNAKRSLDHIEKLLECYEMNPNFYNHLLFDKIELFSGIHSKTYPLVSLKKLLLDDKYNFLRKDKRFNEIVVKLDNISN